MKPQRRVSLFEQWMRAMKSFDLLVQFGKLLFPEQAGQPEQELSIVSG